MTPHSKFPPLWCDFNSGGELGNPDDIYYFCLDKARLTELSAKQGDRVFLYDDDLIDGVMGVVGIEGELIDHNGLLIARPFRQDFYYGPRFW